jgi:hypothetical protein
MNRGSVVSRTMGFGTHWLVQMLRILLKPVNVGWNEVSAWRGVGIDGEDGRKDHVGKLWVGTSS